MAKAAVWRGRPTDKKMAMSAHVSGWSLPCLVLLLLLEIPGAGAQELQVLQPQRSVSVPAGETLTLPCSVNGTGPIGPVKWLKGSGRDWQLVYALTGSFPRVTRAEIGSDTDFTIRISDTRPGDAGVYRCVKFQKSQGEDKEYKSGAGTAVSVSETRAQELQVLQPERSVSVPAGETLTLTCSVTGAGPAGPVKWLKGSGSDWPVVYAEPGSFPRVTRAEIGSNTDFTIRISDTRPGDAGVYRCVKFERVSQGVDKDKEYKSGAGTAVSVSACVCSAAQSVFSSPALWIGIFLEKVLAAAFLFFLSWRGKG